MGVADCETPGKQSVRPETGENKAAGPVDLPDLVSTTTAAAIDALTAIGGYLEASRHMLEQDGEAWHDAIRSAIDKAHAQTMRAGDLVKQIQNAARSDD